MTKSLVASVIPLPKKKLEAYKLRARRQSRGSGLGEEGESGGLRVSFYKHMC